MIIGDAQTVLDMDMAKRVGEKLHKEYPGHLWSVRVFEGACIIKNQYVSSNYGYVLYTSTIDADPNLKCVMRAGGEILERAALARRAHEDGDQAVYVEGIEPRFQPIGGIII